jgi:hypothetical protein
MNKISKIIALSVLILILIVVSYFLYNKWLESKMGLVSFENTIEQEIDGKRYIENKEVGLKFAIPDGWEISKEEIGVSMHSSNFIPFTEDSFFIPKEGCWIEVTSEILKNDNDYIPEYGDLKLMINNPDYLFEKNIYGGRELEVTDISGFKGIKSNFLVDSNQDNIGNFMYVAIPNKNIVYFLGTYIFGKNKDYCLQEFNDFLTTVNIKK